MQIDVVGHVTTVSICGFGRYDSGAQAILPMVSLVTDRNGTAQFHRIVMVTSALVGTTTIALVTYPRFVTEPGGNKIAL